MRAEYQTGAVLATDRDRAETYEHALGAMLAKLAQRDATFERHERAAIARAAVTDGLRGLKTGDASRNVLPWCQDCGRDIGDAEQLALIPREPMRNGIRKWPLLPTCSECLAAETRELVTVHCEECRRAVVTGYWERNSLRHCSSRCASRPLARAALARYRRRRAALLDARGPRVCTCGEPIPDTSRTDARHCSAACRQRAHRRRVAEGVSR